MTLMLLKPVLLFLTPLYSIYYNIWPRWPLPLSWNTLPSSGHHSLPFTLLKFVAESSLSSQYLNLEGLWTHSTNLLSIMMISSRTMTLNVIWIQMPRIFILSDIVMWESKGQQVKSNKSTFKAWSAPQFIFSLFCFLQTTRQ